ncbi:MAG: ABC transporter substrate-binding protein [Chloroflexota bacterium]
MRRLLPQTLIGLVVLIAVIIGAVSVARGAGHRTATAIRPAVLRWADEGASDVASLDPANGPDFNTSLVEQLIYGGLIRFGPGFEILPDLAEHWSTSADGRTYTFYLRPNVRYADGSAVTAADVAYSLNRSLNHQFATSSGPYFLSGIVGAPAVTRGITDQATGIVILDRHHLKIQLSAPDGSFLAKLATPAGYVVSPDAIAVDPKHWDRHAFGTGPFQLRRWVPGSELLLVPNTHYYRGTVHITGIEMPFIPEPIAAYKRYQAGALDTVGSVRFPTAALDNERGQRDFHTSTRLETVFLTLNERRPPFNNMKVRQALAVATDRRAVIANIYTNFAVPASRMVPPGLAGHAKTVPGMQYDLARARRLLAAAGYPKGRGLPTITYTVDQDTQSMALATELASEWGRIGVKVRLNQLGHVAYNDALSRLDFQIAVIDWTADYPDAANFLSQQLHTGTPNNNSGWSNHVFDAMVDRADGLPRGDPGRAWLYERADRLAMQQAANIPLVYPRSGVVLRQDIRGLSFDKGQLLARDWTRVTVARGSG